MDYQNPSPYPFIQLDSDGPDGTDILRFNALSRYKAFSGHDGCTTAKFLVYEIPSESRGIGSLIHLVSSMLRYAICHGRILYLMPIDLPISDKRWRFPGCGGSLLECFFLPLTQCVLPLDVIRSAKVVRSGLGLDLYPMQNERVVRMTGLPSSGRCTLCGDRWEGNDGFFDGLYYGAMGYMVDMNEDGTLDHSKTEWQSQKYKKLWHVQSMRSDIKAPWQSTMVRYILRPRPWVSAVLKDIVDSRLVVALPVTHSDQDTDRGEVEAVSFERCPEVPAPYVSVHVRFGNKVLEQKLKPLQDYMHMVRVKYPHIRNIFLSTETESVIIAMVHQYPGYNFFLLAYPRQEKLMLYDKVVDFDYADEFLYSMANLYAATHAQGFVGTLTSNWCALIMEIERTRGDGGSDYASLDQGSSLSVCF